MGGNSRRNLRMDMIISKFDRLVHFNSISRFSIHKSSTHLLELMNFSSSCSSFRMTSLSLGLSRARRRNGSMPLSSTSSGDVGRGGGCTGKKERGGVGRRPGPAPRGGASMGPVDHLLGGPLHRNDTQPHRDQPNKTQQIM